MEFQKVPNFAQKIQKNGFLGSVWGDMTFWRFQSWKLRKMLPFPEKKNLAEISTRFFEILKFLAQKSQKNRFLQILSSFISKTKYLWKKAFGALRSLFRHLILLKPKKNKMVYFWFLRCLKIEKIALNHTQKFLWKNNF